MGAIAPPTGTSGQYFSSPVRVTTGAVELRDRSISMDQVDRAKLIKVLPGRPSWEDWFIAGGFFGSLYALGSLLNSGIWQSGLQGEELVELGVPALVIVAGAVVLRWLYLRASKAEGWLTYYVVILDLKKKPVTLAAFGDEQRAQELVNAVENAKAGKDSTTHQEAETLYQADNTVAISHEGVTINNGALIPAGRLRVAYKGKIEISPPASITNIKTAFLKAVGAGAALALVTTLARPFAEVIGFYLALACWSILGIGLIAVFIQWLRDKERLQSLDEIYVCILRTDDDEFNALLTPDKQYIEAVIAAINSLVPRPDKRNRRTV
ncbi:MAG: hypothetical protein M3437_01140 [Chloroflexota bacterium]|nr:hypothetical protein [Chloroflexota bacterium]MDQ5864289.1 hypothetical protein [Chloroflexota bacterium]